MIGFTIPKISTRFASHTHTHTCYARHGNRNRDWFKRNNDHHADRDNQSDENMNEQNKKNKKNTEMNVSYLLFESKLTDTKYRETPISLYDVRDAMECCCMIKNDKMRYECYHQFGVDGKMAEKYFKQIERMERQYEKTEEHLKQKKQVMPFKNDKKALRKWFHFNIFDDE